MGAAPDDGGAVAVRSYLTYANAMYACMRYVVRMCVASRAHHQRETDRDGEFNKWHFLNIINMQIIQLFLYGMCLPFADDSNPIHLLSLWNWPVTIAHHSPHQYFIVCRYATVSMLNLFPFMRLVYGNVSIAIALWLGLKRHYDFYWLSFRYGEIIIQRLSIRTEEMWFESIARD